MSIPKLHILTTIHGDAVLIAIYNSERVCIRGAERSMGRAWSDGTYNAQQARSLWDAIIGDGGAIIDTTLLNVLLPQILSEVAVADKAVIDALKTALEIKTKEAEHEREQRNKSREQYAKNEAQLKEELHQAVEEFYRNQDQIQFLKGELGDYMKIACKHETADFGDGGFIDE
jgi:hypothetical protein